MQEAFHPVLYLLKEWESGMIRTEPNSAGRRRTRRSAREASHTTWWVYEGVDRANIFALIA